MNGWYLFFHFFLLAVGGGWEIYVDGGKVRRFFSLIGSILSLGDKDLQASWAAMSL